MIECLEALYRQKFGHKPEKVQPLAAHASERKIFRLLRGEHSVIGIWNQNVKENQAFVELSRHFAGFKLPVPDIYQVHESGEAYLEEDLGDSTLYDLLLEARKSGESAFPPEIETLYGKVVEMLPRFQAEAGASLDFRICYPRQSYDFSAMLWDMRYFEEHFVSKSGLNYSTEELNTDFSAFASYLAQAPSEYFMYRDFQSRNVMVKGGEVFFIDYQGGRKGPLQYDLVSLLFQSKASLPDEARERLLERYFNALSHQITFERSQFLEYYRAFVLVRLMQVLGTYGIRGLVEGKKYFIESIPLALATLEKQLRYPATLAELPALREIFQRLVGRSDYFVKIANGHA